MEERKGGDCLGSSNNLVLKLNGGYGASFKNYFQIVICLTYFKLIKCKEINSKMLMIFRNN